MTVEAFGWQKDRIETPANQRRIIVELCLVFGQPGNHRLDVRHALPQPPIGIDTVVISGIGIFPDGTGHQVSVPLDQTRHQHCIRQLIVHDTTTPGIRAIGTPNGQNEAVPHRDMRGEWLIGIHGNNLFCFKNSYL